MATAPPALPRRGHAFEGGGGARSTQGFGHVGGVSERKSTERKSSESNWKKPDLFDDDEDEDEPLCIVRSVRKGEAPARAPSPITSLKGGSGSSGGGSGGVGSRAGGLASGTRMEAVGGGAGMEKKRVLGEGARAVGSGVGSGPGSPVTKKVKMGPTGDATEAVKKREQNRDEETKKVKMGGGGAADTMKREQNRDEDDEDDVPLASRMIKNVPQAKTPAPETMASKLAAAKKVKEEMKKAKTEGGLPSMANLFTNGAPVPAQAAIPRPSPKEGKDGHGRIPNHSLGDKDEKKPELRLAVKAPVRPLPKPAARPAVGNYVPDSDDSDDDMPLSHRKSMSLQVPREPKLDTSEQKDSMTKKRPAGQAVPGSNPSTVKKLKIVPSGQQSQKSSIQSPKLGSLHSPRGTIKRESDSTPKPTLRRADLDDDDDDDDDDVPLAHRISSFSASAKTTAVKKSAAPIKASGKGEHDLDDDDNDYVPLAKRNIGPQQTPIVKAAVAKAKVVTTSIKKPSASSAKSITKKVLEQRRKGKSTVKTTSKHVVKTKTSKTESKVVVASGGTQKWETLEHSGVIFPPPYQPHGVKLLYRGKPVTLTPEQEEVATMFAVMKDTDYATKPKFIDNFWADWQPLLGDNHIIQQFDGCDFTPIYNWHAAEKEKKKNTTSEEKKRLREEKLKAEDKYMWALVNGVKEKVGNFRVEPPGLFRGRGEHPKMGKLKKRIFPENIVINIGKGAPIPECPMPGHKWKEIRHDNTVTWLAFWNDPINQKEFKYVFLAASSSLKGQSDMEKYEKARLLKDHIENIRKTYTRNFNSSDPAARQIAVATYLIDRLALRAGNEKDEDEADTVGCCSLKVEHVILVPPKSLTFDFLGKDSIRYFNTVEVEPQVYKAIGDFKKGKHTGKDLFDRLDTSKLNQHLKGIMPALTAKVFRTYNASITLDNLLQETVGSNTLERVADYQRANKEVAILCNHQRTVSKAHSSQMEKLEAKMAEAEELIQELKVDLDRARKGKPPLKDSDGKPKKNQSPESLEKKIAQAEQRVEKMKLDMRIKDDLKTVALGTSKINYMDPRISVAWCKRHEVPIEKIFNKSLLAKFAWAMDVEPDYRF